MKIALFAGSFDPFTCGHKSVVDRSLAIADEVVVGIGVNSGKHGMFPVEKRVAMIAGLYADEPRVRVEAYEGLTVDFARRVGASFLVRGVRSAADFEMERTLADVNKRLSGMETVILLTEPEHESVSSSVVRELIGYGKDVSAFLPKGMNI